MAIDLKDVNSEQPIDYLPELHPLVINIGPRPGNPELLKRRVSRAVHLFLAMFDALGIHEFKSFQLKPILDRNPIIVEITKHDDVLNYFKIILPDVQAYLIFMKEITEIEPGFRVCSRHDFESHRKIDHIEFEVE